MTSISAKLKYLRMSPRKVRLAADLMRGKNVKDALRQFGFLTKRSAVPLKKLLESAIANAKNNFKIQNEESLFVKEIKVDEGPMLKRYRPRARGAAYVIRKRTSHVSLVLQAKDEVKKEKTLKVKKEKIVK